MNGNKKAFSLIRRKLLKTVALSPFVYTGNTIADDSRHPGATATAKSVHSPFENLEKKIRTPLQTEALTPLHQLHGTITPADLHYQRHHSGVPDINPDQYRLLIHGLVDKSLQFTLQELKRFPAVSRIAFLECSGNCNNYFTNSPQSSPQDIAGLTSQSEWVGVSLATLLRETGLKPKARWLLAEGGDACLMTRSIPIEKAMDDAMICYAQNGEAIRPEQGYPIRLFLPGWEGSTSVKWLRNSH